MAFYAIDKLHRLYDGYHRALTIAGQELLVVQEAGQVHILQNLCPHMNAPLTYATINAGVIRCPLHGIEFHLNSGSALRSPVGPIRKYPISYDGDMFGVELD